MFNWDVGDKILNAFREEMLIKPQAQLLSKANGFKLFIQEKRYDQIKLLYKLYQNNEQSLKPIGEQFKAYIEEHGKNLLKQVELNKQDGKPMEIKEIIQTS